MEVKTCGTYSLTEAQKEVIEKIQECFQMGINPVCILQTGAGKTVVACEIIERFRDKGLHNILVIINAVNIDDNWGKELKKYKIPYTLLHGKEREEYLENGAYEIKKGNVILTTYDTALNDFELYYKSYETKSADLIIYDEIHNVINAKKLTQRFKEFIYLSSKYQLGLTATPLENTQYDPGLLYAFLNETTWLNEMDLDTEKIEEKQLAEWNKKAKDSGAFISSRKIIYFPYSRENSILISLPLYPEMREYIKKNFTKENEHTITQFLSHPDSIYKNNSSEVTGIPCTKVEAVKILLNEILSYNIEKDISQYDKVIVFSRYVDVLYRYKKVCKELGYDAIILTGDDNKNEQDKKLSQFKNGMSFRILLTTLSKSAEGLNLDTANHIIILEPWWNPQRLRQAMGRINRITQQKNTFVYLLCYNEDGKIIDEEDEYFTVMIKKLGYAREFDGIKSLTTDSITYDDITLFKNNFFNYIKMYISYGHEIFY